MRHTFPPADSRAELLLHDAGLPMDYRRFHLPSPLLSAQTSAMVSVFRTARAFADPSLIRTTYYYFHGGGMNDRQLKELDIQTPLHQAAGSAALDSFQIVAPAIENTFLNADLDQWFEQSVQPWAESGTQTDSDHRWIGGVSMGAFVALQKFFQNLDQYEGVIANAPGILTWNFHDPKQFQAYSTESGLPLETVQFLKDFFAAAFPDWASYDHRNPLQIMQKIPARSLREKSIFLDVGELDHLGLSPTTQLIHRELNRFEPRRLHFEIVPGALHDLAYVQRQLETAFRFILADRA